MRPCGVAAEGPESRIAPVASDPVLIALFRWCGSAPRQANDENRPQCRCARQQEYPKPLASGRGDRVETTGTPDSKPNGKPCPDEEIEFQGEHDDSGEGHLFAGVGMKIHSQWESG